MSIIPTVCLVLLLAALGCVLLVLLCGVIAEVLESDTAKSIAGWLAFSALAMVCLTLFLFVLHIAIGRLE